MLKVKFLKLMINKMIYKCKNRRKNYILINILLINKFIKMIYLIIKIWLYKEVKVK